MRFTELTDKDKDFINKMYNDKSISWDERVNNLMVHFDISERSVRNWFVSLGLKQKKEIESEQYEKAKNKKVDKKTKYYIVTCVQNATKINKNFLQNIEKYAEHLGNCEIICILSRYHNPTGLESKNNESQEWWDDSILKYASSSRLKIHKKMEILSDIKIQPTASMPLQGLESITSSASCVVGHSRVHLKTLPTIDRNNPKFLFTTGYLSKPNFSDSKIGKVSEFHFTYGFVIVEIKDDETFFARQVTSESSGNFNDLYWNISIDKNGKSIVKRNKEVAILVKGDIHLANVDKDVLKRSFNELIPKLKPLTFCVHDLFDGQCVNPHTTNDILIKYQNEISGKNSLKGEIDEMLNWLETIKHHNIVVVRSNHDIFLDRYIINADYKNDVKNALEYLEYAKVLLSGEAPNGLIPYIINKRFPKIKCLGRNDIYSVNGWIVSIHGMDGINGGKASGVATYKRLNGRTISAHGHKTERQDGALSVGTNTQFFLGYNHGLSSWSHSDVIVHSTFGNKAQHIIYMGKNKEFTTFK